MCKVLTLSASSSSLQVEVIVSLMPPMASRKTQKVVLILSSSMPVNWAIIAHGVRGRVSVYVRICTLICHVTVTSMSGELFVQMQQIALKG